jgi:hypothetical protein
MGLLYCVTSYLTLHYTSVLHYYHAVSLAVPTVGGAHHERPVSPAVMHHQIISRTASLSLWHDDNENGPGWLGKTAEHECGISMEDTSPLKDPPAFHSEQFWVLNKMTVEDSGRSPMSKLGKKILGPKNSRLFEVS